MAGALDNKQILVKIFIGIFVGLIGISMLLYLVPQGPGTGNSKRSGLASRSPTRRSPTA